MDFSHPTYLQIFLTASLPIMGLAYALVGGLKLSLVDRLQVGDGEVGRRGGGGGGVGGARGPRGGTLVPPAGACGPPCRSLPRLGCHLAHADGRKGVWLAGSAGVAVSIR